MQTQFAKPLLKDVPPLHATSCQLANNFLPDGAGAAAVSRCCESFSVDQSVFLPAGDQAGIERLIQYMTRCPFSLSRLVKVSDTGQIVYQAEKQACRAFPAPKGDGTQAGVNRNFQILSPLDFLAEFTQHIPAKGSHLIRYYGWYSNKSRGMRKKVEAATSEEPANEEATTSRSSQAWAMLIKRALSTNNPAKWTHCLVRSAVAR